MDATSLSLFALGFGLFVWLVRVVVSLWNGDGSALDALDDDVPELGEIRGQNQVLSHRQARKFGNYNDMT